jgi:site-specific DNA recombinase
MKRDKPTSVRCAIYTRKSTDEGLDSDFNSLDSQREYCEAFIKSQHGLGWMCSSQRYDDPGYSGGTMNRPAFKALMADAEAGQIDCIVVYKLERLSRSLFDALGIMQRLETLGVTLVSVTQQFNTSTSAGRMCMNMMLTLAQYERENASERTRDKIAAARRKGKWSGGRPILGYNIDSESKRLVLNNAEAEHVRAIFRLYVEHERILAVVQELTKRGWRNKQWTTNNGTILGGREFDKCSLFKLLTNVAYVGRVRHKDQTFPGEHTAIVDEPTFRHVQDVLQRNGRTGGAMVRNKHNALLKGLVQCTCCKCAMGHSYSSKAGKTLYRYYLCAAAAKKGWQACPSPSVPAGELESFVVERIRGVARDPRLIAETVRQAGTEILTAIKSLEDEKANRDREHKRIRDQLRIVTKGPARDMSTRVADLNQQMLAIEARLVELDTELRSLRCTLIGSEQVAEAFRRFDELWATLAPHEQIRIIRLLVKRVEWDGRAEQIKIVFHPTGLRGLVDQMPAGQQVEAA